MNNYNKLYQREKRNTYCQNVCRHKSEKPSYR